MINIDNQFNSGDDTNEPGPPPEVLAELQQTQSKQNGFSPIRFTDLVQRFPSMRLSVIEGVLRQGESMNIIAPPKTGKSFLVGGLAWCVATGRPWLSYDVRQCKVLVVDNELHEETLASRYDRIAFEMQIDDSERGGLDVVSLRGENVSITHAEMKLRVPEGKYGLVVFDALYRMLPEQTNENDNGQMMRVYNHIDQLAKSWGAAIVVIHHASKGDQSEKAVTDVGAGAGAISRAADSHLIIRPHEQQGLHVLQAATRSFPSPDPVSIRFTYPLWQAETIEPQIKKSKPVNGDGKQKSDDEAKEKILRYIPVGIEVSESELRRETGLNRDRFVRLTKEMEEAKRIRISKTPAPQRGRFNWHYSRVSTEDSTGQNAS
jgi:hypothetical protein